MKKIKKKQVIYLDFMILMIVLGASDALRGVFAPIFQSHFGLSASSLSIIITVSYVGNLVFLLVGTKLADRYSMKRVFACVLMLWLSALILYILTDDFMILLIGMFIAMGASTLLNTMINLLTPLLFATPGLVVNTLFFTQGIGTSTSQGVVGNLADGFGWWKGVNGILLLLGILSFILFLHIEIPETHKNSEDSKEDIVFGDRISNPAFWYFFLIFGCYFVAEHGIMNWLLIYCREQLEMSTGKASIYLALFFGGITIGRLLLAPFVQKLGTLRSIGIFGSIGAVFYILAIVPSTEKTLFLLGFSGLFISIVYPTLVLAVQGFFQEKTVASVTGTIISAATVFDIGFNLIFGKMIDLVGFRMGFLILPVSILCFILIFRLFIKRIKPERYI